MGQGYVLAGRYRLEERLQAGSYGSQWRAVDQTLERQVVVRVLDAANPQTEDIVDAARRAALAEDPRLVRILDVGSQPVPGGHATYVISEHVNGRTLETAVAAGPLPAETARRIVGEASQALARAGSRGLHHLRLGPTTVWITSDGAVKLSGTAIDAAVAGAEFETSDAAERADAVGLVSVLYAALTGRWPGPDKTGLGPAPRVNGRPVSPGDLAAGVPNDLDTLCTVTLGPHEDGPRTPAELADELSPWARSAQLTDPRGLALNSPNRPRPAARPAPRPVQHPPVRPSARPAPAAPAPVVPPTAERPAAAAAAASAAPFVASPPAPASPAATPDPTWPVGEPERPAKGRRPGRKQKQPRTLHAPQHARGGRGDTGEIDPPADPATTPPPAAPEPAAAAPVPAAPPATSVPPSVPAPTSDDVAATATSAPDGPGVDVPDVAAQAPARPAPKTPAETPAETPAASAAPAEIRLPDDAAPDADPAEQHDEPSTSQGARGGARRVLARFGAARTATSGSVPAASAATSTANGHHPGQTLPAAGAAAPDAVTASGALPPVRIGAADLFTPPADNGVGYQPGAGADPYEAMPFGVIGTSGRGGAWTGLGKVDDGEEYLGPFLPPAPLTRPTRDQSRLVLVVVAVAVVVLLVFALWSLRDFGSSSGDASVTPAPVPTTSAPPTSEPSSPAATASESPTPSPAASPVIDGVRALDPLGDNVENDQIVSNAVDGNPDTAWRTARYNTQAFGGLKTGVGLAIKLADRAPVTEVDIDTRGSDGVVELRIAEGPDYEGSTVIATGTVTDGKLVLRPDRPIATQYLVVWVTRLPDVNGSGQFYVSEIKLR